MKNVSMSGAVGLLLLVTACSFQIGGNSSNPPQTPPPQGAQQPPPPGAPPPAAGARGAPGAVGAARFFGGGGGGGAARNIGQPGPAPAAPPQAVTPGNGAPEPVNVAKIQEIKARDPKACGFLEVAPGVWARVDCHVYQPSAKAITHLSPRKERFVRNHAALWQPKRALSFSMAQALNGAALTKGIVTGPTNAPNGVSDGLIKTDTFPSAVDHRAQGLEGPVKDQGPVGACTAFSLSAAIDNAAIRAGKMNAADGNSASSANHVWAGYGFPQMGAAADATLGRTIATQNLWGQSHSESCKIANPIIGDCGPVVSPPVVAGSWRSDPLLVAKSDRANASGVYNVAGFERLFQNGPVNTEELLTTLSSGADLWVALKIDGFAWSKVKKDGVIPDWNESNGGHAVTMVGFRNTPQGRQYMVHNSWGKSWGNDGYGFVSEAMVVKFMHFAYRVKLADGVKPEDLTDDDCNPNDIVDLFSGKCSPICPNGGRPTNGCFGL